MKPGSARKTASCANGPGGEPGRASLPTSVMKTPICSEPFAQRVAVGAALAMPYADTEAMQLHIDEIARTVARGSHAVLLLTEPVGTRLTSSQFRRI